MFEETSTVKKCSIVEASQPSDEATKSVDASHQRKAKSVEVGKPNGWRAHHSFNDPTSTQIVDYDIDRLLEDMEGRDFRSMQTLCNYGGEPEFSRLNAAIGLSPRDWRACYDNGLDCRDKMVFNVANMVQARAKATRAISAPSSKNRHTTLTPDPAAAVGKSVFTGSEVAKIRTLLEDLTSYYYGTLQKWCNSGGGPQFKQFAKRVPASKWAECYDDTDDCRDIMVVRIRQMFEKLITQE